ncbi:NAD(P)/FAD-dependent oxidoreductase [Methyloprofundus sp.]|uniref:FAD/NAD(P)-dependent oxidoreductase n=1 Tax=Methyloprofundus sp. TaxID=2020875 RepID=UPI003D0C4979
MKQHYQLLIIGAGPAGLAAAVTAADHGISCALLDEQAAPGGQIYRSIESVTDARAEVLGTEYQRGQTLAEAFRNCEIDYFPESKVWSLNNQREVGVLHNDQNNIITADQIIVASGAMERPVPFPGWTLPGVMQAGAGQILFKSSGVIPSDGVVLAGSGPLLLLLAWQYMQVGVEIKAMLDVTPLSNLLLALPKLPRALLAHHYLTKGLSYQKDLYRAGVASKIGVSNLRAKGDGELQSVSYRHFGREHSINTDLLMTHFGVIPHIWLTQAAGCDHRWDSSQQCWRPQHDEWGNTSIEGIIAAGDGAGINGARSAEHAGRLAGLQALFSLGIISQEKRDKQAITERKWMRDELHIRPFLEAYFAIPQNMLATTDKDTIVCRCEEITAGEIRAAVANSHADSNQVKYLSRCGMGPCQGRQCANAVAHIVADAGGQAISDNSFFRGRPPVAPLTLEQLASLSSESR